MPYRHRTKAELRRQEYLTTREVQACLNVSAATLATYLRDGTVPSRVDTEPGRGGRRWFTMQQVEIASILQMLRQTCGIGAREASSVVSVVKSGDEERMRRWVLVEVNAKFAERNEIDFLPVGELRRRYFIVPKATDDQLATFRVMMKTGAVDSVVSALDCIQAMRASVREKIDRGEIDLGTKQ